MMKNDERSVAPAVEKRYEPFAEQAQNSDEPLPFNVDGYAPQTGIESDKLAERLYRDIDLIDLPEPAVNASIGCGNPFEYASITLGEKVVDLGSGGGIDCFIAAKIVGETGYVVGVDATQAMIDLAEKNRLDGGIENVEFRLGRIEELPLNDEQFDLVISNCVIDISPDKDKVFSEAFRVLKPGGRIAFSDTVILGELDPVLKKNVDEWSGAVITPLDPLSTYLEAMVAAGFKNIAVHSLTSYGLENFENLDEHSQKTLTQGYEWQELPDQTGLFSAAVTAVKP